MARARTNWQRLQNIRAHVAKYQAGYEKLQSWEHPPASLAAVACTTLLSFYPHNVLACLLVYVMIHSLFLYRCQPHLLQHLFCMLCCKTQPSSQ